MMISEVFFIDWHAPIVPAVSLAGIPLGVHFSELETVLDSYLVDEKNSLYRFVGSPVLKMHKSKLDPSGGGGMSFSVFDDSVVNKLKRGIPALSVLIRDEKIYAVKIYDFSFPGDLAEKLVYKGCLPGGIRLGSAVAEMLLLTELEFDEAEEWFYTDSDYGVIEVSGWGVPLSDESEQLVTAICVIPNS